MRFGNFWVTGMFFSKIVKPNVFEQLHVEQNPGCLIKDTSSEVSKVTYIRADGENDTVHFLLDISRTPSLAIIKTSKDAVIQANYTGFLMDSKIEFTESPLYIFSTVFNKVRIYSKLND